MTTDRKVFLRLFATILLLCAIRPAAADASEDSLPSPPSAGNLSSLPQSKRAQLDQAIQKRDFASAEKWLVAEIEKNPPDAGLLTFLAGVFFLDQKYLNAAVALKKAEAIAPLKENDRFTLALCYVLLGQREWARAEFGAMANAFPQAARYPYWLGRLEYDRKEYAAAVAHYRRALGLDPKSAKIHDNLALCLEALGEFEAAAATFQQAVRLNRHASSPSPWQPLNLATLLMKLERTDEAEPYLREALRYDGNLPQARYRLGLVLERRNRHREAAAELEKAVALDAAFSEPLFALARVYRRLGEDEKAEDALSNFRRVREANRQRGRQ